MSTDSMPIPSWTEVREALDAQQRRQDEQRKELSTINWLRVGGAVMLAVGFLGGALLLAAWLSNHETDQLRHAINPYATLLTLGGLLLLLFGVNRGANHREHEELGTRLAKLERRHRGRYQAEQPAEGVGHQDEGEPAGGSVIAMPNKKIYELGIQEGERRERERWLRRGYPSG